MCDSTVMQCRLMLKLVLFSWKTFNMACFLLNDKTKTLGLRFARIARPSRIIMTKCRIQKTALCRDTNVSLLRQDKGDSQTDAMSIETHYY